MSRRVRPRPDRFLENSWSMILSQKIALKSSLVAGSLVAGLIMGLRSGTSAAILYQRLGMSSGESPMRASLGIAMQEVYTVVY